MTGIVVGSSRTRPSMMRVAGLFVAVAVLAASCSASDGDRSDAGQGHARAEQHALELTWENECAWNGSRLDADVDEGPLTIYLDMDEAIADELYERDVRSDERLPGWMRLGPDEPPFALRDQAIRFRGNTARFLDKKSFNIRFGGVLPALGVSRANLNAMYTDPSFLREHLSMQMFRDLGLPAPRTAYVDLYLNDVFEGLYLFVQRVDDVLLQEHGLPTGSHTLVRDRSRHVADAVSASIFSDSDPPLPPRSELPAYLESVMDARSADWEDVADLVAWSHGTRRGQAGEDDIAAVLDLDALIDWYLLHVLVADGDAFRDDYWLYFPGSATDSRWLLIPWDKDLTFGSNYARDPYGRTANHFFWYERDPAWMAGHHGLLQHVLDVPTISERADERLRELMSAQFDLRYFCDLLERTVPAIEGSATRSAGPDAFVRHPRNSFDLEGDHALHVAAVLDFVQLRWAFLERTLRAGGGGLYTAAVEVSPELVGESVLITDASGWTLARLDLLEVSGTGRIEVDVERSQRSTAVDRIWTIDTGELEVRAQLSLYYRNRLGDDWYERGAEGRHQAVGRQPELQISQLTDAADRPFATVVNPFSNRVAAEVTLSGESQFVVDHG